MTCSTINPLTGRPIQIGGTAFNLLVFTAYDFINGELVRRESAPPIPPKKYYYNTVTSRRILADSRRYYELINANWSIVEDYYLIPPADNPTITYEQIMDTHKDTLINLGITLCRECFIPIASSLQQPGIEYCEDCNAKPGAPPEQDSN